ncbi:MAG TPA: hypothetical protein DCY13_12755, partial [Verrucomicrobiales bacterium]|nr:hypothetical protein [Verrucomicrobiales bacterium]
LPSLGYEPAELVGRNGLDYVHPDDLKSAQEALVCSLQPDAPQHPVEFRFRHRDGSWVWLEGVGGNLPDEAGQPRIVINCRDVSVRREMQKALRESETRFRQLAESINEVFWIATPSRAEIHYVSPAYDRIWERSGEKLLLRPSSWLESVVPEDRERVAASVEEKGTAGAGEVTYRIRRPNGTVRWIRDRIFPILNDGGGVHLLAGVSRDVTGEIALEEQLRHSQKLEAVGQLAGGVAHDFNNLLAIIQMQSSLLLMDAKLAPELRAGLEEIATAAECGSHLTRQLLTFSRRQQKEAVAVDLGSVVSRTIKMLRRIIGAEVKIESKLEDDLPAVLADPGMLEQVLMNLAVNARDAMPRGGRLVIALDAVRLDAAHVARHPQARPGRFVRLTVSDTGEGIKPEIQQHIFEPFFTTKEVGKGTGLGLATVQGVIRQHDGWIEYSSEVGKGTIFRIYLPPLEHAVSTRPAKPDRSFNVRGTESVLLVEDDPGVRSLARVILIRHGYRVVEAATGTEVLDKLVEAKTGFDLLLTDVVLPGGVSGIELANRLRRQSPNLKVVYTSGYGREFIGEQEQVELGRDFLPKPYLAHDLVVAVRRCLDGG